MDAVSLLEKLVNIESPSGREEEIASFLSSYLKKLGLRVKDDYNVVANPEVDFWIVTHMDTVAPKAKFKFDGKYAYGTGVCDAKGSIAAILLALEKLKKPKFGVAFLRDEEETGMGSELFAREFSGKAIVMEPTSLKIAIENYGVLEIDVKVKGKQAHGATPESGENAIRKAIEMIERLGTLHNFTILKMKGGSDEYVIPDSCELRLDFLLKPKENVLELKKKVLDLTSMYGDVEVLEESEGFISDGEAKFMLEAAMKAAGLRVDYTVMPSWTDAINLRNAGWDVVVWGPGELVYCHTPLERIAIKEIEEASKVIVALNEVLKGWKQNKV